MRYVSTRGRAPELDFADTLLAGLATDGGLYVPDRWPTLGPSGDGDYVTTALEVMTPFVDGAIDPDAFAEIVTDAYGVFDTPEVTPLVDIGDDRHLLELWHGPTLAFKDVALQLVGRLFDHELTRRGERVTVVGATSGDTGSAAIEALRDRDAVDVFILFPNGRVSDVQRRQMTTVSSANVHTLAVDGTFDDCQDLVKAMFADEAFRTAMRLSAVNSINWARVMAQIVYYVVAADRLGGRDQPVRFAVPTGNFGNVFAGHVASQMGLAVDRFVVGSNRNDILHRFFGSGTMTVEAVEPSLSPSMDIQISSNLERLLFELFDRDGSAVTEFMGEFRSAGTISIAAELLTTLGERWVGTRVDDAATLDVIARHHEATGELIDPHTAVGLGAAEMQPADGVPTVVLSTAHPAKFPAAVQDATGERPALPDRMADLFDRSEHYEEVPNDLATIEAHIARVVSGS